MKERIEPTFDSTSSGMKKNVGVNSDISVDDAASEITGFSHSRYREKVPLNFGLYAVALYLLISFIKILGDYLGAMAYAGYQEFLTVDFATPSILIYQASVLVKGLMFVCFVIFTSIRIKKFKLVASLLLIFGTALFSGLLFIVSILDPTLANSLEAVGKLIAHLAIDFCIIMYLILSKKIAKIFNQN